MDSARRRADRKNVDRIGRHCAERRLLSFGLRRITGAHRGGRCIAKRLELAEQDLGEFSVEAAGAGLRHRVGRAERERCDRLLRPVLGERRDDHDLRAGGSSDDPRNGLEAPGTRHFKVEDDDVDAALAERFNRILCGSGDSRDLEGRIAFDHARENRPGDRRIVDDHQPDPAPRWRRPRQAVPRSGERPLHLGTSGDADELKLDVERFPIERLHHIFVGARFEGRANMRHVVLGGAEDDLRLIAVAALT